MNPDRGGVTLDLQGPVAVLTLNEPRSLNALSGSIKADLELLVPQALDDEKVRALLITGTGKAFCAGGDIRYMNERRPAEVRARMQRIHSWSARLLICEKPLVTAVNGIAAGAGFSLAMMGDLVCASTEARFRASFAALGAVPDLGLLYTLPRAIGMPRAKDILLSNRELSATEAAEIGLVSRLESHEALIPQALALATSLAAGPRASLGLTKMLLRRTHEMSFEALLEAEAMAQALAFSTEDFAEGVSAFFDKRTPKFAGR